MTELNGDLGLTLDCTEWKSLDIILDCTGWRSLELILDCNGWRSLGLTLYWTGWRSLRAYHCLDNMEISWAYLDSTGWRFLRAFRFSFSVLDYRLCSRPIKGYMGDVIFMTNALARMVISLWWRKKTAIFLMYLPRFLAYTCTVHTFSLHNTHTKGLRQSYVINVILYVSGSDLLFLKTRLQF